MARKFNSREVGLWSLGRIEGICSPQNDERRERVDMTVAGNMTRLSPWFRSAKVGYIFNQFPTLLPKQTNPFKARVVGMPVHHHGGFLPNGLRQCLVKSRQLSSLARLKPTRGVSTVGVHPQFSGAPHFRGSIPHPNTVFSISVIRIPMITAIAKVYKNFVF